MSAHPTAGVPLVRRPGSAMGTSTQGNLGDDTRSLTPAEPTSHTPPHNRDQSASAQGGSMYEPQSSLHSLGVPKASNASSGLSAVSAGTALNRPPPIQDPELIRQREQMRLHSEATELVQALQTTERVSQADFARVKSEEIVRIENADVYPTPALYFTKDTIQNMRLKITVIQQSEEDLLFRRPRTGKGAMLLQKVLNEKEATLRQLQRVRAEYDRLARSSQLRATAAIAANAVAAASAVNPSQGGEMQAVMAAARAAKMEADTAAELNRLKAQASELQSRVDALTEQTQAAAAESDFKQGESFHDSSSGQTFFRSDEGRGVAATVKWQQKVFSLKEILRHGHSALLNQGRIPSNSSSPTRALQERYESEVAETLSVIPTSMIQSPESNALSSPTHPLTSWDDLLARTAVYASRDSRGVQTSRADADIRISTFTESDIQADPNWLASHAMIGPVTNSKDHEFNPVAERVWRNREISRKADHLEGDNDDIDSATPELFYIVAHVGALLELQQIRTSKDVSNLSVGSEHVLCCVRAYPNGTFETIPPLSPPQDLPGTFDPSQWYFFRTKDGSHYRYRVELASAPPSEARLATLELELVTLLVSKYRHVLPATISPVDACAAELQRAAQALSQSALGLIADRNSKDLGQSLSHKSRLAEDRRTAATALIRLATLKSRRELSLREREAKIASARARIQRAGTEFARAPPSGSLRYTLLGEITAATGFQESNLLVEWRLRMPENWMWSPADDDCRSGSVTHTSYANQASGLRMTAVRSEAHPFSKASEACYAAPSGATQFGVEGATPRLPTPNAIGGRPGLTFQTRDTLETVYAHGGDFGISEGDSASFEAEAGFDDTDALEDQPGGDGERGVLNYWCCLSRRAVASQEHLIGHPLEIELVHRSNALEQGTRRCRARRRLVDLIKNQPKEPLNQPEISNLVSQAAIGSKLVDGPLCDSSPLMLFSAFTSGTFSRYSVAGNAFIALPTMPGSHVIKVRTWRPVGSIYTELSSFFLGGGARLADPTSYVAFPEKGQAVKMGMVGRSGGWVDMKEGGGPVNVAARRQVRHAERSEEARKRQRRKDRRIQKTISKDAAEGIALLRSRRDQLPGAAGRVGSDSESGESEYESDHEFDQKYREDLEEDLWLESSLVDSAISSQSHIDRLHTAVHSSQFGENASNDGSGSALGAVSAQRKAEVLRPILSAGALDTTRNKLVSSGQSALGSTSEMINANEQTVQAAEPAPGSKAWSKQTSQHAIDSRGEQVRVLETHTGPKVASTSTFVSWTGEVRDLQNERDQPKTIREGLQNNAPENSAVQYSILANSLSGYGDERSSQSAMHKLRERERFQGLDPTQVTFINKYGLLSEPAGTITLMLNVVMTVPDDVVADDQGFEGLPGFDVTGQSGIAALLGTNDITTTGTKTGATQSGKLSSAWHIVAHKALERRKIEAKVAADSIRRGTRRFGLKGRERALSNWRLVKALLPLIRDLKV